MPQVHVRLPNAARTIVLCAALVLGSSCGPQGAGGGGGGGGGGGAFGPIAFSNPTPDSTVEAPFTLTAAGSGIFRVFFIVNGLLVLEDRSPPFTHEVDPALLPKGASTYTIVAQALSGSEIKSSFSLKVVRPRPPVADLLAAINGLAAGEWYEIPETQMRDVNWPVPFGGGRGDQSTIILAASGGAYDTKRDRLVVWGSGGDSFREDLYAFSMNTLSWSRLTDPPAWPVGGENNALNLATHLDGTPVARHSNDTLEYIPDPVDRLFLGGGTVDGSGGLQLDPLTYTFNFDTNTWTPGVAFGAIGLGAHAAVAPDGRVWQHGGGQQPGAHLAVVDVAAGTTSEHVHSTIFYEIEATSEIDPVRNLLVAVGNHTTRTWDLALPNAPSVAPVTTGDTEIEDARNPGLAYHAASGHLIAWAGGKDVYRLDLGTLTWTKVAGSGTVDPGPAATRGTYGRWRYVPSLDVFVVVSSVDANVFVYRLP